LNQLGLMRTEGEGHLGPTKRGEPALLLHYLPDQLD
jgi:hypothetical protein